MSRTYRFRLLYVPDDQKRSAWVAFRKRQRIRRTRREGIAQINEWLYEELELEELPEFDEEENDYSDWQANLDEWIDKNAREYFDLLDEG